MNTAILQLVSTVAPSLMVTVDGRNPAPVEVGSLSHYLQGFIHPRWLAGFLPTVC